jgi:hypothetical protein
MCRLNPPFALALAPVLSLVSVPGRWLIVSDMDNPNHPPRRLGQPEMVR